MIIPGFTKTYGRNRVLNFPGMEFTPGKIYGVLGANGSGKSTFSKILAGIVPADEKLAPVSQVGYLPQKPYGFRMSVKKNLLLGGGTLQDARRLMEALSLTELENKRADRLSGGETARMAMARLMMNTYALAILDEPTAAMDEETTVAAEELIRQYVQDTGCVLLLITHSLQQARRIADQVLFFRKGELLEQGPAERQGLVVCDVNRARRCTRSPPGHSWAGRQSARSCGRDTRGNTGHRSRSRCQSRPGPAQRPWF